MPQTKTIANLEQIQKVAHQIAQKFRPKRIILFKQPYEAKFFLFRLSEGASPDAPFFFSAAQESSPPI